MTLGRQQLTSGLTHSSNGFASTYVCTSAFEGLVEVIVLA